jgi:hypothetical protein
MADLTLMGVFAGVLISIHTNIMINIVSNLKRFYTHKVLFKTHQPLQCLGAAFCETNSGCRRAGASRCWVTSGVQGCADMGI